MPKHLPIPASARPKTPWLAMALFAMLGACDGSGAAQAPPSLRSLTDVTPETFAPTLRRAEERVLVANFWSTWCRPCMEEMPALISLTRRYRRRGVGAAFVSMDIATSRADALRFMREQGAPSPSFIRVGRDADFIPAVHGSWSGTLPATILYDAQRQPQRIWVGEVPLDELEQTIEEMLDESE